ncbi:AtpZ/AtpI family protein [Sphingopyxis sp. MWB1]|uniref:AtpZ/AtpI family protein n=1 Tax=Sphingopyxis sp. MWB1 TaxID=1537715 RepID=UPI00051A7954|nr:AtpZ/AtpI family protein [Sphingopyxis sp. MWB1]
MTGNGRDPESTSEDSRLASLQKRLGQVEAAEVKRNAVKAGPESDANYRLGNRVLAELLGGLIGGALFGWLIDRFAGTSPWGFLGMLFVGVVVAFRNIIRLSSTPRK